MNTITKFPYIVYWFNKKHSKWQVCKSIDKAQRLKKLLNDQKIYNVWIAKDI